MRRSPPRDGALACLLALVACSSSSEGGGPSRTGVVRHVIATGQSNSVGYEAKPPVTRAPVPSALMFDVGVMTATDCDGEGCRTYVKPSRLVPLTEGDVYDGEPVETPSSGFASAALRLGGGTDLLVSVHGRSGYTYECLRKGSCGEASGYLAPFDEGMRQVEDGARLAHDAGKDHEVLAVTVIHGESDHYVPGFPLVTTDGTGQLASYADALLEWQRDYDRGVRAITGQKRAVPLLFSQIANWNDRIDSDVSLAQVAAHARGEGRVVLVGPTYTLPYGGDCIHFTAAGSRHLGELFGKVFAHTVVKGQTWEPVRPLAVTRDGAVIDVRFAVPVPPLVLDTNLVADPGSYGFSYADDDGPAAPTIVDVVASGDHVTLRLDREPTASGGRLSYAENAVPKTCPGPTTGPRGNLRDSDATASGDGVPLYDWAVAFRIDVP